MKLNKYLLNEKDYKITASDTSMTGKIVIELSELPSNLQKSAIKNLKSGNYEIDELSNWLVINI